MTFSAWSLLAGGGGKESLVHTACACMKSKFISQS